MAEIERKEFEVYCIEKEGKWLYEVLPAIVTVDRYMIKADGVDKAVITANVPNYIEEVKFYNCLTNDEITTMPVVDNKATIEITATTPGRLLIRAEQETKTKHNEVEVIIVEP